MSSTSLEEVVTRRYPVITPTVITIGKFDNHSSVAPATNLNNIRDEAGESLKSYFKIFNNKMVNIENIIEKKAYC